MIIYKINFDYYDSRDDSEGIPLQYMQVLFDQYAEKTNKQDDLSNVCLDANTKFMYLLVDDVELYNKSRGVCYNDKIKYRNDYAHNMYELNLIESHINTYLLAKTSDSITIKFDKKNIEIIPYNYEYVNRLINQYCPIFRQKVSKLVNRCELISSINDNRTEKEIIQEMGDISNNNIIPAKKICSNKSLKGYKWEPYVYIVESNLNNFTTVAIDIANLLCMNNRSMNKFVYRWVEYLSKNGFDPYLGNTIIFDGGVYCNDAPVKKVPTNSIYPYSIYSGLLYNDTHTNVIIRSNSAEFTKKLNDTFNGYGVNCIVLKFNIFTFRQAKNYVKKLASRISNDEDTINSAIEKILGDDPKKEYLQENIYESFKLWQRNRDTEIFLPSYKGYFDTKKKVEEKPKNNSLNKLNDLIGLNGIKDQINKIICTTKMEDMIKTKCGGNVKIKSHNMVFTGNPGTGKTVVGKLIAKIFYENKVIKSPKFVYAGREDLVGKYVGWTATKVKEKFEDAKGGVLFIDEAYSLIDDNFGQEAINTLVKFMDNNKDTIVIFAGYPKEIKNLIDLNPGMESRIKYFIDFPDYSIDELVDILKLKLSKRNLKATDEAIDVAREKIKSDMNDEKFGNGRYIRNLLEKAIENHAVRISKLKKVSNDRLVTIEAKDFEEVDTSKIKINNKSIGF